MGASMAQKRLSVKPKNTLCKDEGCTRRVWNQGNGVGPRSLSWASHLMRIHSAILGVTAGWKRRSSQRPRGWEKLLFGCSSAMALLTIHNMAERWCAKAPAFQYSLFFFPLFFLTLHSTCHFPRAPETSFPHGLSFRSIWNQCTRLPPERTVSKHAFVVTKSFSQLRRGIDCSHCSSTAENRQALSKQLFPTWRPADFLWVLRSALFL